MNVVLFDDEQTWKNLLPLTFTRPVSEIRFGVLTIKEKWEKSHLAPAVSYCCVPYLSQKFKSLFTTDNVFINSAVCPNNELIQAIRALQLNQALFVNDSCIAYRADKMHTNFDGFKKQAFNGSVHFIKNVHDIFTGNDSAIKSDFELLTTGKKSEPLDKTVTVLGDPNLVFLEKGAKARACILNTQNGPIYLAADSEIMEGSVVRGPLALCEHSVLKMSAKIYGATTIGPHSKVGGEINNSVIFGYSNKAHDGFLGNSVIGEWCNLGADTNNSNLKNNYGDVKLYNYAAKKQVNTGLQFCGLIMGDYSKAGINTMFNTGTVVGVACNIYGGGFPPTHIPSFSWGGSEGFTKYELEKLFETSEKVFARRDLVFGQKEKEILSAIDHKEF